MADKKISALTSATTPLAGTEVLPIVQASTTVKVAVSDLTAGRTFSALGMTLTSTDAGATAAPTIDLYRDSATPAASDTLGEIEFNGEDSAGNKQAYGLIHASILSPTSTAEQGQLHFETATAGALTEKMIIGTTNLVINEIGAVFNVRIEGDTDANLFYTDATNSRVGVGTVSPAEKLDVVGNIKLSGNVVIANGQGIDFSATSGTGTSELLDDYEEGTFTPTLQGGTTTTYTTQDGKYTIIGRQVFFQMELQINSLGNGSNNTFLLNGLPSNGSTFSTISVGFFATLATAVTSSFGYINSNSTAVTMQNIVLANTASGTAATFGNGTRVILSGQYSI